MLCFELTNDIQVKHSYFCNINISMVTIDRIIILRFIIYICKSFNVLLINY
uniref:hypothetical protein n=1 Tax=Pachymeniopsis lanceolata TaxID=151733 RepID=UPI002A7EB67E|nr:hypothetical protein UYL67_pgp125 [Pachymeniopsis lanceolata]WOL37213.1 hypothetical protein [Pachymeniopsis lanceolata]